MRNRNGTFLAAKFTTDNNTPCHNILHLKALYLSYWTLISGILTVGVAEEGRPQFSECTQ